jgi:uncharacterized protein YcbK (DUF882 family)
MASRDWSRIRYFSRREWGEGADKVDFALVERMDGVRALAGVPVHVHVAWADSGHSPNSMHYRGLAVDFHFGPGLTPLQEYAVLAAYHFGGVGHYPFWRPRPGWHVDIRPARPGLMWVRTDDYHYGWRPFADALAGNIGGRA